MATLTPSPSFSLTIRLRLPNRAGMLAEAVGAIASAGGNLGPIGLVEQNRYTSIRDLTVDASSTEHAGQIVAAVNALRKEADVFIGVSAPGILAADMVRSMAKKPIVMALANPVPEIQPEEIESDAAVIATGRSDYPNQINNVLAFPGVFRGALDCRASQINTHMLLAATEALAALVAPDQLRHDYIIPSVFDERVMPAVSAAVQRAARENGVARV